MAVNEVTLLRKIVDLNVRDDEIIQFIETHSIHVDTYLSLSDTMSAPIFYIASKYVERVGLFSWLIQQKCNPNKLPDFPKQDHTCIYGYCHEYYIPIIKAVTNRFSKSTLIKLICRLLTLSKAGHVCALLTHGVITRHLLKKAIRKNALLYRDVLSETIQKLVFTCQHSGKVLPSIIRNKVHNIMNNCARTFNYMIEYGYIVDLSAIQIATVYYLSPVVDIMSNYCTEDVLDAVIVVHHKALDPTMVKIMRQIYNDGKYSNICHSLGREAPRVTGGYRQLQDVYRKDIETIKRLFTI